MIRKPVIGVIVGNEVSLRSQEERHSLAAS